MDETDLTTFQQTLLDRQATHEMDCARQAEENRALMQRCVDVMESLDTADSQALQLRSVEALERIAKLLER